MCSKTTINYSKADLQQNIYLQPKRNLPTYVYTFTAYMAWSVVKEVTKMLYDLTKDFASEYLKELYKNFLIFLDFVIVLLDVYVVF